MNGQFRALFFKLFFKLMNCFSLLRIARFSSRIHVHQPTWSRYRREKELREASEAPEYLSPAKTDPPNPPQDLASLSARLLEDEAGLSIEYDEPRTVVNVPRLIEEMCEGRLIPRASLIEECLAGMINNIGSFEGRETDDGMTELHEIRKDLCKSMAKPDVSGMMAILRLAKGKLGVRPTGAMWELIGRAHLLNGNVAQAEQILTTCLLGQKLTAVGHQLLDDLVAKYLQDGNEQQALCWFDRVRGAGNLPLPATLAKFIRWMAVRSDRVEAAEKLYRECSAQGMPPALPVLQSLLAAYSKHSPRFYSKAIDLYRTIMAVKGKDGRLLDIYNTFMGAAGRSGDLPTVFSVWQALCTDGDGSPDGRSYCTFLWSLAGTATETSNNENVKRTFSPTAAIPVVYQIRPEEIFRLADAAFAACDQAHLVDGRVMTAYLACLANHHQYRRVDPKTGRYIKDDEPELNKMLITPRAYQFFWSEYERRGLKALAHDYQAMLALADQLRDYPMMRRLKEAAQRASIQLSFLSWRAMIRTAALTNHLEEAIELVREMRFKAGHPPPSVASLRVLHLRLCEAERWELRAELGRLCRPIERAAAVRNPYTPWRERSLRVGHLLKSIYGVDEAPRIATNSKAARRVPDPLADPSLGSRPIGPRAELPKKTRIRE